MSQLSSRSSPLEDWSAQLGRSGRRVLVKRDDLLPFPLAGNKVRKLGRELSERSPEGRTIITVGAITSNHCRTAAYMAARQGVGLHLVLHGDRRLASSRAALAQLDALGARVCVVEPPQIRATVERLEAEYADRAMVIEGGCHTPAGVRAYAGAVVELASQVTAPPDTILVATGTGATHAGLVLGCLELGWSTRVVGVSVARESPRAEAAVREAIGWCDPTLKSTSLEVTGDYRAGGYGRSDDRVEAAVARSMRVGLPADPTYMGKVMSAFFDLGADRTGDTVVIWHTGGLANYLGAVLDREAVSS